MTVEVRVSLHSSAYGTTYLWLILTRVLICNNCPVKPTGDIANLLAGLRIEAKMVQQETLQLSMNFTPWRISSWTRLNT